ncbi:MAG: hypothetical protein JNM36_16500 [Chitinophagales bacterium]|jgi:protocatechuate 3,4-dioxygenase beta subunit|nr:hypothetical protein [Chitinophagales bacterium]HNL07162.1 hypothetical protein [Chitinophagales bacterium]
MKRVEFLRHAGLLGLSAIFHKPLLQAASGLRFSQKLFLPTCIVVPEETAGPYPLNLSGNMAYYRQNIAEDRQGSPLHFQMTIVNINDNCNPIVGARVDAWHCDKDGYYSGYTTNAHLGQQNHIGETFCRGIQITDANGQVNFTTIFPGWYPGRTAHIHFRVYLGGHLEATSQFTFPVDIKNQLYTSNALYSVWGADPVNPSADGIFSSPSGAWQTLQLMDLTVNTDGSHNGTITVGVDAPVTTVCSTQPIITGNVEVCQTSSNTYSVPAVTNATYQWTITGGSIISGQNTNSVTVQWTTGTAGTLNILQVNP